MNEVIIHTDGSCLGNPGPGGYGIVWEMDNGTVTEYKAGAYTTTNNRMELEAVVTALSALKGASFSVKLYTDSKYVCDAINQHWLDSWIKNGWKTSTNTVVKNIDLWSILLALINHHTVEFIWVKGHNGDKYNERCDQLAREAAKAKQDEIARNNQLAVGEIRVECADISDNTEPKDDYVEVEEN